MDPERAAQIHPNDRQRMMRALEVCETTGKTMTRLVGESELNSEFKPVYAVLSMPRDRLYAKINQRFDRMMSSGLLEEVRQLRDAGFGNNSHVANAYGYAELLRHLAGEISLEEAVEQAKAKTRVYARRQLTWFRALEDAHWFEFPFLESEQDGRNGDAATQVADELAPLVRKALED